MIPQDVAAELDAAAAKFGVDRALVYAIAENESGFNQSAVSHDKNGNPLAYGVMQVLPSTAAGLGYSDVTDLHQNVEAGVAYIAELEHSFGGNVALVAAGYNAGAQAVVDHGNQVPPYAETRAYVPKVVASYQKYKSTLGAAAQRFVVGDQLQGANQWVIPQGYAPVNLNPFDPAYWNPENSMNPFDLHGPKLPDIVIPIVNTNSPQEKAYQKIDAKVAKQDASAQGGWQGFIAGQVHDIETNMLLGGIVLALVAGGFALIASDNPGAARAVASKFA